MKGKFLPAVIDAVFVFVGTFAAVFAVLRFYVDGVWVCAAVSAVVAVSVAAAFRALSKRRRRVYALKAADRERLENALNSLSLMTDEELCAYFLRLFELMRLSARAENGRIFLEDRNAEVRFYFTFSPAYAGRVIDFYKETGKGRNLIVLGREFTEEITSLADRFAGRIIPVDGAELYALMKNYEYFPPVKAELKKEKPALSLPRALLSKKRAKQYFLYGLTLEFFALFVFYPLYYAVFGAALMALSVACYFFGFAEAPARPNPFRKE